MAERRKHEPTQRGNPRQLTVAQHIHSRWCISNFADKDGCVAVLRRGQTKPFCTKPDNDIFCVKRAWGEHLERGLFLEVEGSFHEVVKSALTTGSVTNHQSVTKYITIWQIRAQFAERPPDDVVLQGIESSPLSGWTKDEEEILEKKRCTFLRGATVSGRLSAFMPAVRDFHFTMSQLKNIRWGVLRTKDCPGFICPDRPAYELYVPIARTVALVAGYVDQEVDSVTVDDPISQHKSKPGASSSVTQSTSARLWLAGRRQEVFGEQYGCLFN